VPTPAVVVAQPAAQVVVAARQVAVPVIQQTRQIIVAQQREVVPDAEFDPLSDKPVVLDRNDVKSHISIVSIPNVHNVPFEHHVVAHNERLGRTNCPGCETHKEAAQLRS